MDAKVENTATGLFPVHYRCSTGMAGAPELTLSLMVNTPNRMVSGIGSVTQAILPSNIVTAQLTGSYQEYSDVNGPNYIVSLDGYAPGVVNNDTSPVLQVEMTLVGGWETGTANFSFRRAPQGPTTHITDDKVTLVTQS